jgi:hypothetical protein
MTRERLADGDDGSGNRYPVRETELKPALRATSERYQVRIWCDGDELILPFVVFQPGDYYPGEELNDVAARIAQSMLDDKHGIAKESAAVSLYLDESEDCTSDTEPLELARSIQYRE